MTEVDGRVSAKAQYLLDFYLIRPCTCGTRDRVGVTYLVDDCPYPDAWNEFILSLQVFPI